MNDLIEVLTAIGKDGYRVTFSVERDGSILKTELHHGYRHDYVVRGYLTNLRRVLDNDDLPRLYAELARCIRDMYRDATHKNSMLTTPGET